MARRKVADQYRRWVTTQLKTLVPRRWDVSPYTRTPENINVPTVIVTLQRIQRLPEAPLGGQIVSYLVTVIDPAIDPAQADAALDDEIVDLIAALDGTRNAQGFPVLRWTSADRASYADTYLAFDITVEVVITPNEEK